MVLNETTPSRKRMEWTALLSGVAALLVVAGHAVSIPEQFGGNETSDAIGSFDAAVAAFCIPTLLVLSGLLLEGSLGKGPCRYAVGKIRHIVWPCALWFFLLMASIDSLVTLMNPMNWLSGGILWYLMVPMVCYAAAMARPGRLPWEICALAPLLLLRGGALLGLFVVGGVAASDRTINYQQPAYVVVSVLGILFALRLTPRIPSSPVASLLQGLGRSSIVVYLGYAFAVCLGCRVLAAVESGESETVVPALAIVGVGFPALLVLARRKIDWLFVLPELPTPTPAGAHGWTVTR